MSAHTPKAALYLAAAAALTASAAPAQVILLDQQPNQGFSLLTHIGVQSTADDFIVSDPAGATIIGFTIWGTWGTTGMQNADTFDVLVHDDDPTPMFGNEPNNLLASFPGLVPVVAPTGAMMGTNTGVWPEYSLEFVLPSGVTVAPGTYWIELYSTGSSGTGDQFSWGMTAQDMVNGEACMSWSTTTPGVVWNSCTPLPQTDMAIQVRGESADVSAICFGDGGGTACPCGNTDASGGGCANSTTSGAVLDFTGVPSLMNDSFVLVASNVLPNQPGLFFQGEGAINGGAGSTFGDGLRCCGTNVVRIATIAPDGTGCAASDASCGTDLMGPVPAGPISQHPGNSLSVGDTRCYQFWYRDPSNGPCGTGFNLTNALEATWQL